VLLGLRDKRAGSQAAKSFRDERGAESGEPGGEFGGGFGWTNFECALKKNVAGIHAGVNAHGGDSGARFTVDDGPIDGSGTAIFGKQRRMEVDPAEFWNGEELSGDELAVGDDNGSVWRELLNEFS